jgi:hypothetical protein
LSADKSPCLIPSWFHGFLIVRLWQSQAVRKFERGSFSEPDSQVTTEQTGTSNLDASTHVIAPDLAYRRLALVNVVSASRKMHLFSRN